MQLKLPNIHQRRECSFDSKDGNNQIVQQTQRGTYEKQSKQTNISINNSVMQTTANQFDLDSYRSKSNQKSADNTPKQKKNVQNYVMKKPNMIPMKQGFVGKQQTNGEWQHVLPPLPTHKDLEQQQLKDLVKSNIKFVDSVPKLKLRQRLKYCFIAIQAVLRWIKFTKNLITRKKKNLYQYEHIMMDVKFNDQLKAIRFKQWTQMVFSKLTNQIKLEKLDTQTNINIIDNNVVQDLQEYDKMLLKVQHLIKLFLEGLLLTTNPTIFLKELASEMFASQFEEQRTQYFLFTSLRTLYLREAREELPQPQKTMLFAEFIIMRILLPNFVILVNQDKYINMSNPQTAFIIKLVFSFLHYLYQNLFYLLEFLKSSKRRRLVQYKINFSQSVDLREIPFDKNSQDLIIGIYSYLQLKPLLESKRWAAQMKGIFRKIIQNLEQSQLLTQYA